MLKSTHKPIASQVPDSTTALPEGWTEHKAPTGHSYYYHAETKKSTYQRPTLPPPTSLSVPTVPLQVIGPSNPSSSFLQYQSVTDGPHPGIHPSRENVNFTGRDRENGHQQLPQQQRPRGPQPTDKPKSSYAIPGQKPWILVHTKLGRRFVYNPDKDQSYWRIPDKLKPGILELDQQRILAKAANVPKQNASKQTANDAHGPALPSRTESVGAQDDISKDDQDDGSSEYEEVEVTDDEAEDSENNSPKRQRISESAPAEPIEFNEDDIAFQLAAMGQDYGLDPSEYHNPEYLEDEEAEEPLSHSDATALFCDLLNDHAINPYSPWDKLISDGIIIDDSRYTCLSTMKARKEAFDEWSRTKIATLRSQRAHEASLDPKIPYLNFLQQHATPKLYYPEFRRKFRKEPALRDSKLPEKEREKLYRDLIARRKLAASVLKTDFLTLLKEVPLTKLNNQTLMHHLPSELLVDLRYVSCEPVTRDALLEGWISMLSAPPVDGAEKDEEQIKEEAARRRREMALREREERVEEAKRKQRRALEFGRGRLREEEAEIERAMNVGKGGLKAHLMDES